MKFLSRLLAALFLAAPLALPALSSVDGRIEEAARQSYSFRILLEGRVRISVNQGRAILFGYVSDPEARALAEDTVENLPEVTGIINNITVTPRFPVHSDSWLTARIRQRLLVQANVSAASTTVQVYQGIATLGGTAPGHAQKELAGIYAAGVDGVKSVTNNIIVREAAVPPDPIDDASVTALVKFILRSRETGGALPAGITTAGGAVRLTGDTASEAAKTFTTQLVQNVRGVASVTNDMAVKG